MIATVVEGKQLLETVVVATIAGIGITFVFSIAIWGVARFADFNRNDRHLAATVAASVAALALVATAAAVVAGIIVMTSK